MYELEAYQFTYNFKAQDLVPQHRDGKKFS